MGKGGSGSYGNSERVEFARNMSCTIDTCSNTMKQSSCVQGECVREKNEFVENMSRQHNTKFVCV